MPKTQAKNYPKCKKETCHKPVTRKEMVYCSRNCAPWGNYGLEFEYKQYAKQKEQVDEPRPSLVTKEEIKKSKNKFKGTYGAAKMLKKVLV